MRPALAVECETNDNHRVGSGWALLPLVPGAVGVPSTDRPCFYQCTASRIAGATEQQGMPKPPKKKADQTEIESGAEKLANILKRALNTPPKHIPATMKHKSAKK